MTRGKRRERGESGRRRREKRLDGGKLGGGGLGERRRRERGRRKRRRRRGSNNTNIELSNSIIHLPFACRKNCIVLKGIDGDYLGKNRSYYFCFIIFG